jgi:hypothetical protein
MAILSATDKCDDNWFAATSFASAAVNATKSSAATVSTTWIGLLNSQHNFASGN